MNEKSPDGGLEKRLGMLPQMVRRLYVLCVDDLQISDKVRTRTHENLARLSGMKPSPLPSRSPGDLDRDLWSRTLSVVRACVKDCSPSGRLTDNGRTKTEILGARAVLDDLSACKRVLRNVFVLGQTTGLIKEGWEVELARQFGPDTASPNPASTDPVAKPAAPVPDRPVSEHEIHARILKARGNKDAAPTNRYTVAGVETRLAALLSGLKLRVPEDAKFIREALTAARDLASQGYSFDGIPTMTARLRLLEQSMADLRQRGIDGTRLMRLVKLDEAMAEHGLSPEQVDDFLGWNTTMRSLGFSPDVLGWFMTVYRDRVQRGMAGEVAFYELLWLAHEPAELNKELEMRRSLLREIEDRINELNLEIDGLEKKRDNLAST